MKITDSILPPRITNLAGSSFPQREDLLGIERKKKFLDEFMQKHARHKDKTDELRDSATASKEGFSQFVTSFEGLWRDYFSAIYFMDILEPTLGVLYPEKVRVLRDLSEATYRINQEICMYTAVEKEVYSQMMEQVDEERIADIVASFRSFPTFAANTFGGSEEPANEFNIRMHALDSEDHRDLLNLCGGSISLMRNVLNRAGLKPSRKPKEVKKFEPKDEFEEAMRKLFIYDHFSELFMRESGALGMDTRFYDLLSRRLATPPSFDETSRRLAQREEAMREGFEYPIPGYQQKTLGCGVACLMNVLGLYWPWKDLDKTVEQHLLKKVTTPDIPSNIPSSIARVAREDFGIDASFFADYNPFRRRFIDLEEASKSSAVLKFEEDLAAVPLVDRKKLTPQYVKAALSNGRLISYVGQEGSYLHYRLIYGFKTRGESEDFLVFDPIHGKTKISAENLPNQTRNNEGFWGVEYELPEAKTVREIQQKVEKLKLVEEAA